MIVVGAGVGGLATAIALRRMGHDVQVIEQARTMREVGSGLTLFPNGTRALTQLGLGHLVQRANAFEQGEYRDHEGRVLVQFPFSEIADELGFPTICLHRADLQKAMLEAAGPTRVRTNARCVGVEQDAAGATVRLADGETLRAEAVVGADGVRSVVRSSIFGDLPLRPAAYTAIRAVVDAPAELPSSMAVNWLGPGSEFGLMPMGNGQAHWFGTLAGTKPAPLALKEYLLESFAGWDPIVRRLIAEASDSNLLVNDISDLPTLRRWSVGRVTLLGDAAHATTPHLGQGAALALEDAVELASQLSQAKGPVDAFAAYERTRKSRTRRIVRASRALGRLIHLPAPLARSRNLGLRIIPRGIHLALLRKMIGLDRKP